MKRAGKLIVIAFMFAFLINLVSASVIQVSPLTIHTTSEVSLKSTGTLCSGLHNTVDAYIIKSGGTILVDVRGKKQEINLTAAYQIPFNTKIWLSPEVGNYDVIIDCDRSGSYNPGADPKTSFSVVFKKGSGNVSAGKVISDYSWQYDSEQPDLVNEMLDLRISAQGENILLGEIVIKASGTGNDTLIDSLEIYVDENKNMKADENEAVIGSSQPAYSLDDGETAVNLDYVLKAEKTENILIVYKMKEGIGKGDFSLTVKSISGIGENSGEEINFIGVPVNSNKLMVLPEKTCLGTLIIELLPGSAKAGENILIKFSNLTGCDNKTVFLRTNPCTYFVGDVSSCVLKNSTCSLNVPSSESRRYYACIDKNEDKDMTDFGESAFADFVLKKEEKINESKANLTGEANESREVSGITGWAINFEKLADIRSIFILLEITLLLILFVLIVISFRLRAYKKANSRKIREKGSEE